MRLHIIRFYILLGLILPVIASAVTPMIAAGVGHAVALKSDGTLAAWGWNAEGELGDGTNTQRHIPVVVPGLSGVMSVSAGAMHTVALKTDSTVVAWGWNNLGELGDGTTINRLIPVTVSGISGVVSVAAGGSEYTIALKADGTVWAWGDNRNRLLGNIALTNSLVPMAVQGLSGVVAVSAGGNHAVALKADGTVLAWGWNLYGQLGDGTLITRSTPVVVPGLSGVVSVSAGSAHTVALKADGTVVTWGYNGNGQLGDGTTTNRSTPAVVSGLSGVVAVAAGDGHTIALKSDGTIVAWGVTSTVSIYGTGAATQNNRPVAISGLTGVVAIAAGKGNNFTLALKFDGTVVAWGNNNWGQLGNGTTLQQLSPVAVMGLNLGASTIVVPAGLNLAVPITTNQTIGAINFTQSALTADGTATALATATSGLAVSFSSTTPAVCTVSGNSVTGIAAGTCIIAADQAGDANYYPAVQVMQSISVVTGNYGSALNLVNAVNLLGSIWSPGGITLGGGLNYSTQAGYGWSQQLGGMFVTGYSMQGSPTQIYLTQTTPMSVAVTVPVGAIIEVWDIETMSVVATNIANPGSPAVFSAQPNHRYGGFAWYADNSQQNLAIYATTSAPYQAITLAAAQTMVVGTSSQLWATSTAGLYVNFSSNTPGICTVSNGTLTGIAAGNCIITADQPGNGSYTPAAQVVQSISVVTANYGSALNLVNAGNPFGSIWGPGSNGITLGGGLNFSTQQGVGWSKQYGGIFVTGYSIQGSSTQIYLTQTNPLSVTVTVPVGAIVEVWDLETMTVVASNITNPGSPAVFSALPNHRYGGFAWYSDNSQQSLAIYAAVTPAGVPAIVPQSVNNQVIGTITVAPLAIGGSTTISANATSGLAVSFTSLTPTICSVTGSTVTGIAAGTCTIAANQAGNASYNAAPQVTQSISLVTGNYGSALNLVNAVNLLGSIWSPGGITLGGGLNYSTQAGYGWSQQLGGMFVTGYSMQGSPTQIYLTQTTPMSVAVTVPVGAIIEVWDIETMSVVVTNIANPGSPVVFSALPNHRYGGFAWYADNSQQNLAIYATTSAPYQAITLASAQTMVVGLSNYLWATSTAGLSVNFSSTTPGICAVNNGTLIGIAAGICIIAADQPGNASYNPAAQVMQSIPVVTANYGSALNLLNSGNPFSRIWGPGSNGITLGGGLNYSTQQGVGWSQQYGGIFVTGYSIQGSSTQIYLTQTNPLSVTVTVPVGAIVEVWDLETMTVVASNITNPGSPAVFSAQPNHRYGGFAWYADNSQQNLAIYATVTPAGTPAIISQTISNQAIGTITVAPLAFGGSTTISASATSGLAVSFTSLTPTICSVTGSTVTGIAAGTCTIAADQAGNANYNAAPQVTQNINVTFNAVRRDFNADGKSDILWRGPAGEVAVWLMNGSALQSSGVAGIIPANWQLAGTGDFNGDGRADIVRRGPNGEVAIWIMNGSVIQSSGSVTTVPLGWNIASTDDFNGDGKADLLWRGPAGEVAVWLMNGSTIQSSSIVSTLPAAWVIAESGDFNGDGKADILWHNTVSGENSVWLMNGAALLSSAYLNTLNSPWLIAGTGDFNGDGKTDILWRNTTTGENAVWVMNGASISSSGYLNTLAVIWSVSAVGDYNGDGKADILWRNAATGENAIWLINGLSVSSSAYLNVVPASWAVAAQSQTAAAPVASLSTASLSFAAQHTGTTSAAQLVTLSNTGSAVLNIASITASAEYASTTTCGATLAVGANCTFSVSFTPLASGLRNGAVTVTSDASAASVILSGTGKASVSSDFNGDSNSDILLRNAVTGQNVIWLMNGTTMSSSGYLNSVAAPWNIAANGDFDGDGKADILWRDPVSGNDAIWFMNGTAQTSGGYTLTVAAPWNIIGAADFDGDGKADLLWRDATSGANAVWLMNGLTQRSGASLSGIAAPWALAALADFNGDGKADLLWRNGSTGQNALWLMNGTAQAGAALIPGVSAPWSIVGTGDFDGDGKADILWRNTVTGENAVWYMNGAVQTSGAYLNSVPVNWVIEKVADYNGDGKADILWRDSVSGMTAVWLMNGAVLNSSGVINSSLPAAWGVAK